MNLIYKKYTFYYKIINNKNHYYKRVNMNFFLKKIKIYLSHFDD